MNALTPIPMRQRAPDEGFPKGWYFVAEAKAVDGKAMLPVAWLDQHFVVYRTPQGVAQVADAFCPHLGAHLASHTGHIENGQIVCPFHHWRFDSTSGRCVAIPYANTIPQVSLTLYPTREVQGMILMWYHPAGLAPDNEPFVHPQLSARKWIAYAHKSWRMTCPFRDILENLVDTAHIVTLHSSNDSPQLESLTRQPYGLAIQYKTDPEKSDYPLKGLEVNFSNLSLLTQFYKFDSMCALFMFGFTPIDRESTMQNAWLYIEDTGNPELVQALGKPFVERWEFETNQDIAVLNYKKHLPRPRLCDGDGPILRFRAYANEIYA